MTRPDRQAAQDVVELITGGWRAQALYTAVRLRLPDHIAAGRTTTAELAAATGADADGIHRLMRLLVAMGVVDRTAGGGHRNTPVSAALVTGPDSMRDLCLLYGEQFYAAWAHAHDAITTARSGFELAYGQPLYAYLGQDQDASDRFQGAMQAGNLFFDAVPGIVDFTGRTVVDLGGGNGALLSTILRAAPGSRGVLLDGEHVVPVAKQHLADTVGLDRVEILAGSMFDAVPPGGDVYLLCRVLAGHPDDDIVGLLTDIRRNLVDPSSRLLLLDRLVDDENPTVLPSLWDLHLLMTTGGRHRSLRHLQTLLDRAGLRIDRSVALPAETTALIACPAS